MKISVVVPVYNEEHILPKLLTSLKNQTFPKTEYEVIIVNNNCTDNSAVIAKQYGAKVVYESKPGIVYARLAGAKVAKGDIIFTTDADCLLPNNFLVSLYRNYQENAKLVGLCGSVYMPHAPFPLNQMARLLSWYGYCYANVFHTTPISWALNLSFKKQVFTQVGGYTIDPFLVENGVLDGADECVLVTKLSEHGHVAFDRSLVLQASPRRFKGRLLYWFLAEYLLGFIINRNLYRFTGYLLPTPSYFARKEPSRKQKLALRFTLTTVILTILSSSVATAYGMQNQGIHKEKIVQSIQYYQGYEKQIIERITQPIVTSEPFRTINQP